MERYISDDELVYLMRCGRLLSSGSEDKFENIYVSCDEEEDAFFCLSNEKKTIEPLFYICIIG